MTRRSKVKSTINNSRSPSFFKVLVADDFNEKLRIPQSFIEHFDENLPVESIVTCPNGRSWTIQVKRIDKDLCFYDGWQTFVNDNSLEFGDFVVFKYCGNSKFKVKIYGRTGCEKDIIKSDKELVMAENKEREPENGTDDTIEINDDDDDDNIDNRHRMQFVSKRRKVTDAEKNRAYELATSAAASCERPHFFTVMAPSNVSYCFYLIVPFDIASKYLSGVSEDIILNFEGKKWTVKHYYYKFKSRAAICGAEWIKFVQENNLEVGDVCVFERATRKINRTFVLNVQIFRVVNELVPLKRVTSGMMIKKKEGESCTTVSVKRRIHRYPSRNLQNSSSLKG